MEKNEFDVVIVGGGHNALACAAYLGRAGVDVCILEGRHEWGGALYTAEHTAPGFCHNIHANFMEFLHYMPFYADFDLAGLGARTIFPRRRPGSRSATAAAGRDLPRGHDRARPARASRSTRSATRHVARSQDQGEMRWRR